MSKKTFGRLSLVENSFDLITIAFGLRNVTEKQIALESIFKALKPGDFTIPAFKISGHEVPAIDFKVQASPYDDAYFIKTKIELFANFIILEFSKFLIN